MIVVAGEALVDLVLAPDGTLTPALGGAPFNTARTCGRLTAPVTFAGAVGTDRFGVAIAEALAEAGVRPDGIQRVDAPTTLALAELDDRGAASYRFYLAGTSAPSFTARVRPGADDALYTGGLGLVLEPMATTVTDLVTGCPESTLVMVDVNCRPAVVDDRDRYLDRLERVLARADVVKVSDDDLAYLAPGVDSLEAAGLIVDRGARAVLVTRGGDGVTVLVGGARVDVEVEPVEVVDTIGAGDSFGGGFLSWWCLGGYGRADLADLALVERAVRRANAVASVVCSRRGADPPRLDELPADWIR